MGLVRDHGQKNLPFEFRNKFFGLDYFRSAIVHGETNKINKLLRNKTWEENIQPIRCYSREATKFFFQAGCLDNADKRRKLLEKMLIFEPKIKQVEISAGSFLTL